MGQCVSRKSAQVLSRSSKVSDSARAPLHRKSFHKRKRERSEFEGKTPKQNGKVTIGTAMSFGFRGKRPATSTTSSRNVSERTTLLRGVDKNGNGGLSDESGISVTSITDAPSKLRARSVSPGCMNRFGFRATNPKCLPKGLESNVVNNNLNNNYLNSKISKDIRETRETREQTRDSKETRTRDIRSAADQNRNRFFTSDNRQKSQIIDPNTRPIPAVVAVTKIKLQEIKLPQPQQPQVVRVVDKMAKQAVNQHRKLADKLQEKYVEMDSSPMYSRKPKRNLELFVTERNRFDIRDSVDDSSEGSVTVRDTVVPLPKLPSVFDKGSTKAVSPTGIVREKTMEYERKFGKKFERNFERNFDKPDKPVEKLTTPEKIPENACGSSSTFTSHDKIAQFRRKLEETKKSLSAPRSDDTTRKNIFRKSYNGEKMSQSVDFTRFPTRSTSISSSFKSITHDDSCQVGEGLVNLLSRLEKETPKDTLKDTLRTSLTSLSGLNGGVVPKRPTFKEPLSTHSILSSIHDVKFVAAAEASSTMLLEDETSPVDSLLSTDSDDMSKKPSKKQEKSSKMTDSNTSKDINEKSSPDTPSNGSLSLSDGKDYFDDEIADQPALVTSMLSENVTLRNGTTPLVQRRAPPTKSIENSPLPARRAIEKAGGLGNRTSSLDTLSPCESIASDDLMGDYDQSHISGFDGSLDRLEDSHIQPMNDTTYSIKSIRQRHGSDDWTMGKLQSTPLSRTKDGLRSPVMLNELLKDQRCQSVSVTSRISVSANQSPMRFRNASTISASNSDELLDIHDDIMNIKRGLHKLKLVLERNQINDGDSMENAFKELICTDEKSDKFELADLRRQVIYLQGELEDRECALKQMRVLATAKETISSNSAPNSIYETLPTETCNAATQTDRVRPLSAGSFLHQQSENRGSFVSMNDLLSRSQPLYAASKSSDSCDSSLLNGDCNNNSLSVSNRNISAKSKNGFSKIYVIKIFSSSSSLTLSKSSNSSTDKLDKLNGSEIAKIHTSHSKITHIY